VELAASGYLYTIAVIGITFSGFSILTMIFRQMLGGQMTKFDGFVTLSWIQLGFMTTLGSILPPLLALYEIPTAAGWRASSGVMAVILGWWALTFPRRRLATNPTRLPIPVWLYAATMDFVALALAINATIAPAEQLVGIYATAVTAILVGAGMLFLFAMIRWYVAPIATKQPKRKP
jgi:MFS family permease